MPKIQIDEVQQIGVNKDLDPSNLLPNEWTSLNNVRLMEGHLVPAFPYSKQMAPTAVHDALAVFYYGDGVTDWWVTANTDTVAADADGTFTDITPAGPTPPAPTANAGLGWNGGFFHGLLVLNNGVQAPYYWDGSAAALLALPNWTTDYKARVIRPHRNFLIAMNITDDSSNVFDKRVLWGDPAEPGQLPSSWDPAAADKRAGWQDLTGTNGKIIDGLSLNDVFLVYKEDAVWAMNFVGGNSVWEIIEITKDIGLLATDCVVDFPGGHVVLTQDDLVYHDGSGGPGTSILTRRNRRWLFQFLTPENKDYWFVTKQPVFNEIWVCFPGSKSDDRCTRALCWNWNTGALFTRNLAGYRAAAHGLSDLDNFATTWAAATGITWDTVTTFWDQQVIEVLRNALVMVGVPTESPLGPAEAYLHLMDVWDSTVSLPAFKCKREDLAVVGRKADGSYRVDHKIRKLVTELWPRITTNGNCAVTLRIGGRENPSEQVTWVDEIANYDPQVDNRFDCLANFPYIAVEFRFDSLDTTQLMEFCFFGYDLHVEAAGER